MDATVTPTQAALVGARVRDARTAKQWTQANLAEQSSVPRESICRLEKGREAYVSTLLKVEKALDLKRGDLLLTKTRSRSIPTAAGGALRRRRRRLGKTLAECAAAAGLSTSALSRLERDLGRHEALPDRLVDRKDPWLRNRKYAQALGFESAKALRDWCRLGLKKIAKPPPESRPKMKPVDPDPPFWEKKTAIRDAPPQAGK